MLNNQLPESRSCQNVLVLDKFSENINGSKRSGKEYGLKNSGSKTSGDMRIILEFSTEVDEKNSRREEDLKEIREILSGMLENFMRKSS